MIDFRSEPYEWRSNMNIIMENVTLDKIEHNNDKSMLFYFSNTYDGDVYKNLLCKNVWKFFKEDRIDDENTFPCFICDVRMIKLEKSEVKEAFNYLRYGFDNIPVSSEYTLICMDSGEICIELICESIDVEIRV